ncbi:MAG TPA: hypothetical protein PKM27_19590, partial [Saprospiraceae bacterium]|nr:hypothetical protein [Saprospiraceae bacterium]
MNRLLLFLLIISTASPSFSQKNTGPKPLPNGKVKDQNGKVVDLNTYTKAGKITIVSFWATWCG